MDKCTYCGEEVSVACRSTCDMEERINTPRGTAYQCFAALMFMGGGERCENQAAAQVYWRMADREIGVVDMLGGPSKRLEMPWSNPQ